MATQRTRTLPSHEDMVRNIVANVRQASVAEVAAGAEWYANARAWCATLAAGTSYTTEEICGVVAALSPQCPWSQNQKWATAIVHAHSRGAGVPVVSTRANRNKAWHILDGQSPSTVLGGPKVRSFYANLVGDTAAVTVDSWAYYAAVGVKLRHNQSVPKWAYPLIVEAYRDAARQLGITPAQCQAAAWVAVRGSAI